MSTSKPKQQQARLTGRSKTVASALAFVSFVGLWNTIGHGAGRNKPSTASAEIPIATSTKLPIIVARPTFEPIPSLVIKQFGAQQSAVIEAESSSGDIAFAILALPTPAPPAALEPLPTLPSLPAPPPPSNHGGGGNQGSSAKKTGSS